MRADRLTTRELNRATLARQLLLARSDRPARDTVEHLVGLQAQIPLNPYVGLWSRLRGFDPDDLGRLVLDRELVRIVVMRGTLHLVTADDALLLRPLAQPVLDREIERHRDHGPELAAVDLDAVARFARPLLEERPRSGAELRAALAERFPGVRPAALALACRNRLALVQVPPRGVWGRHGPTESTTAEAFLGRPLVAEPSIDEVVLRYLGAFGPATVADVAAWSGLTGLREVVERLRPRLRPFVDDRGRELVDLPDAPRPDAEVPAPPRFLPEYDNVLLSHADRRRVITDAARSRLSAADQPVHGSVLRDGFVCATWRLDADDRSGVASLTIDQVGALPKRATASIAAEGRRLLGLLAAGARTRDVRFEALG